MNVDMSEDERWIGELEFAEAIAREAGAAALRYYGTAVATYKEEDSPVTAADHAANDLILAHLRERYPRDAVLSEESADTSARLTADRVWIVDPLDGTKEFLAQNGEFSVMIGLVAAGKPVLGVVFRAADEVLYSAAEGIGAWKIEKGIRRRLECAPLDRAAVRMVGSRSHGDPLLSRIQEEIGVRDVSQSGSVGLKCALIAEGSRDLYVHPVPYLKEWDTCAPEVVLREAGGWVSDCEGKPLVYNKPDPVQPHGILAVGADAGTEFIERILDIYRTHALPD